jgi:rfaE bifunctional protein kinase chain/domain
VAEGDRTAVTENEILDAFTRLDALVVGDVCLDRWCRYEPRYSLPSAETGIPRVAVVEMSSTPGAAGTIACNLRALGARRVAVLGVIGDDGHGWELRRALDERGIDAAELVDGAGLTFTYTKLRRRDTGIEDLPRVDYLNPGDLPAAVSRRVVERFLALAPRFDVIVVSDQMELATGGVVGAQLRAALAQHARDYPEHVVWVDSRCRAELYRHVMVKLNEREAREACARLGAPLDYERLRRQIAHRELIVTRGAAGALIVREDGVSEVACRAVEHPVDICGAGDAFNAAGALSLRVTGDAVAAARLGNLAAGVTIGKPGTGTATAAEVLAAGSIA